jgi:ATP-dependent Lon protease
MKESAQAALSYLRSHARELKLESDRFAQTDVHIHVPAGAVPKDGPSAGVAIAAALLSLFRDEPVRQDLAMTGELTLTGRILPVGGVKEKVLAARRAGIQVILIPRHNQKDLVELPAEVKADMKFHAVDTLADVVPMLFPRTAPTARTGRSTQSGSPRRSPDAKSEQPRGPRPGAEPRRPPSDRPPRP